MRWIGEPETEPGSPRRILTTRVTGSKETPYGWKKRINDTQDPEGPTRKHLSSNPPAGTQNTDDKSLNYRINIRDREISDLQIYLPPREISDLH